MYQLLPTLNNRFVGFDQFFSEVENALTNKVAKTGFPAYDIIQSDDTYTIEMAVAGYTKNDIEVTLNSKTHVLTVKGNKSTETKDRVYSGIANRNFVRTFTLNPHMYVESCRVKDGMLSIVLAEQVSDEQIKVIDVD